MVKRGKSRRTERADWLLFLFRSVRIGAARQLGQRNEGQLMASFVLVCFSNHPSPSVLNPFYTAGQNPTKRPAKFKYNEPNYGLTPEFEPNYGLTPELVWVDP
jgi:hypothetical protein